MKKLLLAATLLLSLSASTCAPPVMAQDRSWPEYSQGARVHIVGIGALQRLLNERGYRVKVDNQFGSQTKSALIRFQKSRGLEPSGIATGATWEKLIVRVRRGSRGQAVRAVQEMLSIIGFKTQADGVLGAGTEGLLKRFQKARGLEVDGVAGTQTWSVLVMEAAMTYE